MQNKNIYIVPDLSLYRSSSRTQKNYIYNIYISHMCTIKITMPTLFYFYKHLNRMHIKKHKNIQDIKSISRLGNLFLKKKIIHIYKALRNVGMLDIWPTVQHKCIINTYNILMFICIYAYNTQIILNTYIILLQTPLRNIYITMYFNIGYHNEESSRESILTKSYIYYIYVCVCVIYTQQIVSPLSDIFTKDGLLSVQQKYLYIYIFQMQH
eukprot:TRINITY_DN2864_c1_g1_i14.p4 TRINITY_DN2864_c1_g1~~TRINITY_DN2864_c1_g1_i14.p4  ORF type:complete len:211 (+),score=-29.23 TRINITY_DN2864_c1_g1_i14:534-1166(+)